uniref:Enoyl-[acyl-carrier-protein] reductase, mitochondrial n=1 Tax=Caenorhabditis japonica TaxID=281687 RepID=A0A8R1E0Z5_CAEJA
MSTNIQVAGECLESQKNFTHRHFGWCSEGDRTVNVADKPAADQILVKWIAAPINPADLNQIQGVYPVKPTLPAVGGNEGFGKVISVGSSVNNIKVGDHTSLTLKSFSVNPPTAYRMLKDFVDLKKGDIVVQNGANSAVGKQVIQICRILGVKSVNVVRKRENLDDLVKELKDLGADDVITQEELYSRKKKFRGVKLALNCVGGRSSLFLASLLDHGGCMVTYGGMSKQPVESPTGPLIFKDISLRGFWMSRWYEVQTSPQKRQEMYKELAGWMKSGEMQKQEFGLARREDRHPMTTAIDRIQENVDNCSKGSSIGSHGREKADLHNSILDMNMKMKRLEETVVAQQKRIDDMEMALMDEKKNQEDPEEVNKIGVPEDGSLSMFERSLAVMNKVNQLLKLVDALSPPLAVYRLGL